MWILTKQKRLINLGHAASIAVGEEGGLHAVHVLYNAGGLDRDGRGRMDRDTLFTGTAIQCSECVETLRNDLKAKSL